MSNPNKLPLSACVVVFNENDEILSCSRKTDEKALGFAGGKKEPNESPRQCAARETHEESDLVVMNLRQVYEGDDGHGYWCHCFYAPSYLGVIRQKENEGLVQWVEPSRMVTEGYYADFNVRAFNALRALGITKHIRQSDLEPTKQAKIDP